VQATYDDGDVERYPNLDPRLVHADRDGGEQDGGYKG
jgi:hypothetical protein